MTKEYTIYTTADPGPAVVELTAKLIENLSTIDTVRFVAFHEITENRPGVYIPDTKEVFIDLGNILNNADLYRLGMMYIPAVYYTLLWTLFHEITHGRQCEEDPELAELILDAEDYEQAAQKATKDMLREWAAENTLPPLTEWGYLGERITDMVNDMYVQGDTSMLNETECMMAGAVATIDAVMVTYEFEYPHMMKEVIDEGDMGIKIGDTHFLTATDFFGLDEPLKSVAQTAQTVSME